MCDFVRRMDSIIQFKSPIKSGEVFQFRPIGRVESEFMDKFGTPRQSHLVKATKSFIRLKPEVQPEISLDGLAEFTHVWVIFVFHLNENTKFSAKVHPPRTQGDKIGVFATRSPHRPNPIGLSSAKIEKIEKNGIWVSGLDLVNRTPILDIKPYLPLADRIASAKSGWIERFPFQQIQVRFEKSALSQLVEFVPELEERKRFRKVLVQMLKQDPRPLAYKKHKVKNFVYAVQIGTLDVHFRLVSEKTFLVEKIVPK